MGQTLLIILVGCLLGAIQLIVGVAIGAWLRRPLAAEIRRSQQDIQRAQAIARRLQTLASEISTSAHEHRTELEAASHLLLAEPSRSNESMAELVLGVVDDVVHANQHLQSKLDSAENRLQEQATEIEAHMSRSLTDQLTGLPNRRAFDERLAERLSAWHRRRDEFSLLLLDVDHFKKLNDDHGHVAGDQVLAAIAGSLRNAVRREDIVARYGGEEFAVLLPATGLDDAVRVAEKSRLAIDGLRIVVNRRNVSVTSSVGAATAGSADTAELLIQRADAALYAAKAAGRNCSFLHDGHDCRPAALGEHSFPPHDPSAEMLALIGTTGEHQDPLDGPPAVADAAPPREPISAQLANCCAELRRHIDQEAKFAE